MEDYREVEFPQQGEKDFGDAIENIKPEGGQDILDSKKKEVENSLEFKLPEDSQEYELAQKGTMIDLERHFLLSTKDFRELLNSVRIITGSFGLMLNQVVHLIAGPFNKLIDTKPTSNFCCVGLNKAIMETRDNSLQYIGCNKKFINESGELLTTELVKDFIKNHVDKFLLPAPIAHKICHFSKMDCHVSYIYNMLTTWFYLFLYEMNGDKRQVMKNNNLFIAVRLRVPYYEDSHCEIRYNNYLKGEYIEVEVPVSYIPPNQIERDVVIEERCKSNYFDSNYVLRLPSHLGHEATQFYLAHVFKRQAAHPYVNFDIGFDSGLKKLAVDFVGLMEENDPGKKHDWLKPNNKLYSAETVLHWILQYVEVNNLDYEVLLAFEMLFRSAFWPIPETQEGCIWPQTGKLVFGMPPFRPMRGAFPNLFEGEKYIPRGFKSFSISSIHLIQRQLILNALENYAVIYALQTQIYARTHKCKSWYSACSVNKGTRHVIHGWNIYKVLFKHTFNVDIITNMTPDNYVTFSYTYTNFERVRFVQVKPNGKIEMLRKQTNSIETVRNEAEKHLNHMLVDTCDNMIKPVTFTQFRIMVGGRMWAIELEQYFSAEELKQLKSTNSVVAYTNYNEYLKRFNKFKDHSSFFVTILPAWVTGAIIDGSVTTTSLYTSVIHPIFEVKGRDYMDYTHEKYNIRDVLQITQTMRYMNHDLTWLDRGELGNEYGLIKPWANVHQRLIEPSFVAYNCSTDGLYLKGDTTNPDRNNDVDKFDVEHLLHFGFKLLKTRGVYCCVGYKSTIRQSVAVFLEEGGDQNELNIIASLEALPGTMKSVVGLNAKQLEEVDTIAHFQIPGMKTTDPTQVMPGEEKQVVGSPAKK